MTMSQIQTLLKESEKIGSFQETYWEVGEPFSFYPVMVEGIRLARQIGFKGGIKLRGRAVEKFADVLPTKRREELKVCPYEDLLDPTRVHIDPYGNEQICRGISMGNCWKTPLSVLVKDYDAKKHPICDPLVRGGSIRLIEEYDFDLEYEYVDEYHLCYAARLALLDQFPEYLAPRQVYGHEKKLKTHITNQCTGRFSVPVVSEVIVEIKKAFPKEF
jgi:hypothetical protein